ncbi:hypothetical protein N7481_009913 [Penicillium waksmanii]|uniref:uncharacterized protein n=1 Tax=Penicillium waksmanii TaxID=69791 RepID=UPI0025474CE8|nr:uncharacterized protein N7481_009913 [Penicillium waksmanii]KAJ5976206.1 hypothetical protein N7481_009913 [Penicillium waksmanii]
MSACSRGALSRALRLDVLRLRPRYPRQLALTIPSFRSTPPTASSITRHGRHTPRLFSTTRFQRKAAIENLTDVIPVCCPGCGAFSQTVEPDEPGYYGASRKQTRKLLATRQQAIEERSTELGSEGISTIQDSLPVDDPHGNEEMVAPRPIQEGALLEEAENPDTPSLESPTRTTLVYNRVYHVIDAADFPMSLIPRVHDALSVKGQRSLNRRASHEKYHGGQKLPSLSFIITRSDLLAATKEQVDSKMEYVRNQLRAALGRAGRDIRLGNIHMVSAHRGWWTKQVKEEIRQHGGGIWVVGKANVGKSSFIEACFPKDQRTIENMAQWIEEQRESAEVPNQRQAYLHDPNSILPPAPREDQFPVLPVVSSMPGTTVSPIRIPFGRGKGEVIDLPGMQRGQLEDFVRDEHKRDLIMTKRVKPQRCTVKPGQSLLLGGGLIRLTPVNPDHTLLAACFIPIETHLTKTEKAIEIQTEQRAYPGTVFMSEGTGSTMKSAGKFDLKWDTTRSNLPTSVAKAVKDRKIPIPQLPYQVMSADILVEGCGWIEVSVQVRAKRNAEEPPIYPQVEVFTPNGKHIGSREPMECWNFIAEKLKADRRKRPRMRYRYS